MTLIEIDKNALLNNVSELHRILGKTKLGVVLKSNAYGHGMLEVSSILDKNNLVDCFNVASLAEAIALRKSGASKKILVLSYIDSDITEAFFNNIEITIHNEYDLENLILISQKLNKSIKIHLKVDTGMNRLGFKPREIINIINIINSNKLIVLEGIFTHLCDTGNPDKAFSFQQLTIFDKLISDLSEKNINIPVVHAISSSGLSLACKKYDLLRAGALLYGLWKSESHKNMVLENYPDLNLLPVLKLSSKIISIKDLLSGESIGYDLTYTAHKNMKIAILSIGYSEGVPRQLSNIGQILIIKNNIKYTAHIIGIISMNLMAIDVTDIPVNIYDTVYIIGDSDPILARQVAAKSGLIANQVLCALSSQIKRIIV